MKLERFQNWFESLDEQEKKQVILRKACFYLGRRDYSRKELQDKLLKKYGKVVDEMVEEILDFLEEKGWQSDERFEEVFVRSKIRKGIGPSRIKRELKLKGVDLKENKQIEETDFSAIAEDSIAKKYRKDLLMWEEMDYEDKQKLKAKINRFLAYRGLPFIDTEKVVANLDSFG